MSTLLDKAKSIRALALDVDGVLTNGLVYYSNDDQVLRSFNLHDGLGIKLLQNAGLAVAIITAKSSEAVLKRARDLNIAYVYHGIEAKQLAYEEFKATLKLGDHEIAYMGDDLPDLPILRRVGFAATVPQAPALIKQHVDLVTNNKGGKGAVRELCEFILEAQGHLDSVIQSYLT